MSRNQCSVPDCTRDVEGRGLCASHYARWRRHGDPRADIPLRRVHSSPDEKFAASTKRLDGHLVWTGRKTAEGYAVMTKNGRQYHAHRYAWERAHGPVPEGMQVDHICHVRDCVDLSHLRLASPAQNQANRAGPNRSRKELLPRGVSRNGGGFSARVGMGGRTFYLGTYPTPELAAQVASHKRAELFGAYAGH